MKKLAVLPICFGCLLAVGTSHAADLKQSKVTQVVNQVQIISAADQKQKSAAVNDLFSMPDILRTGTASRAELVASDETVTRVGANTIFSFDPANRTIDLKQGSLLFHSPHGKGGGTIHTGSATASVLGSTLIVATTTNGGFKVLALEDAAEIKFLNGLKQKLEPGQMTFILPGGNQLAPVVIFRLDELTQNSLLVKGFSQPLTSLPLIQNQIDKQIKLIQSGKASDTGFYAGDDASANQVEVLDPNTIPGNQPKPPAPVLPPSPPPAPPSLDAAEATDASIHQASLTDASIPTPPLHVFTDQAFPLTGNNFFGGQMFSGFVARNIFVTTSLGGPNPLVVDLSPYSLSTFDIVAVNNISIEDSVTFNGLSSQADLALIAGNQFMLTPGIAVRADTHDFLLSSPADLTLDNVSLYNLANNLSLNSGGNIFFQNGSLLNAAGKLTVSTLNNISAVNSQFIAGSAEFRSLIGAIAFDNVTLTDSGYAIFKAPTAINFNNSIINADSLTLNGAIGATISIQNTTINAPNSVTALASGALNIAGSTINANGESGEINLASVSGSTTISGSSITAKTITINASDSIFLDGSGSSGGGTPPVTANNRNALGTARYLKLNSGDGILLTASGRALTPSLNGTTANFTAGYATGNSINVNNTDFSSFTTVNMAANTIVLVNDIFSTLGIYNFGTHRGDVVINGQNPGGLSIINSYLGSVPITTTSQVNLSTGPGNAPGLYSYANGR